MCLAIPGKVTKIEARKATIEYPCETREALLGDESITVGDYVRVQMGIAIEKISAQEALEAQKGWTSEDEINS
jgi:hydrogenase assembly chaperone HypC/HupF